MKHFIVIDMQNDFIDGALANPAAAAIIPKIEAEISKAKAEGAQIIFTRDTHDKDYLKTGEGKHLPVEHCIYGTKGWEITPVLNKTPEAKVIDKKHFGYEKWDEVIKSGDEVTICGTCTDICVVSNALAIKMIEDVEVNVIADCCAGLTPESHEAALTTMKMCQCNII